LPAFSRPPSNPSTGCGASSTAIARAASATSGSLGGPRQDWIPAPAFKRIAGARLKSECCKEELFKGRPLVTDRRCVSWSRQRAGGVSREMGSGNRANYLEPDPSSARLPKVEEGLTEAEVPTRDSADRGKHDIAFCSIDVRKKAAPNDCFWPFAYRAVAPVERAKIIAGAEVLCDSAARTLRARR